MLTQSLEYFEKLYTSKQEAFNRYSEQPEVNNFLGNLRGERKKDGYVPERNEHKNKPIDGQFLALSYNKFFKNEGLMKKIANKTGLLLVLLQNKVDWKKNEKLNLYQEYFVKRKLLVASISRVQLARMFGKEKRRITAWTKVLEKDGLLKIERIACDEDDDRRIKYNVYILGEVNDDGTYTYYYETAW
jgi:hypothetical protein